MQGRAPAESLNVAFGQDMHCPKSPVNPSGQGMATHMLFPQPLVVLSISKNGGHDVSLSTHEATVSETDRVMLAASKRRRVTKVLERVPNVLVRPLCMTPSFMSRISTRVLGLYTSAIVYITTYCNPGRGEHWSSWMLSYGSSK